MNITKSDLEAIERRAAETRKRKEILGRAAGFRPVSLGDWLDLCAKAHVPAVPALCLGETALEPLLRFDEPEGEAAGPFYREAWATMEALGDGWMARWDCCSLADVKSYLSEGEADWRPEFAGLRADDFRAYDILWTFPSDRVRAWARPWLTFATHRGWPVEYRVFVTANEIAGISNYYPQRSLEDWPDVEADLARVRALTAALIAAQAEPLICPELDLNLCQNHWTVDFARLPSGAILFLEGGPPHTPRWGAHPCCFEVGKIEGVALRDRSGRFERDAA